MADFAFEIRDSNGNIKKRQPVKMTQFQAGLEANLELDLAAIGDTLIFQRIADNAQLPGGILVPGGDGGLDAADVLAVLQDNFTATFLSHIVPGTNINYDDTTEQTPRKRINAVGGGVTLAGLEALLKAGTNVTIAREIVNNAETGKLLVSATASTQDKATGQIYWNGTRAAPNSSYSENPFTWSDAAAEDTMPGSWVKGVAAPATADPTALRCLKEGSYSVEFAYTGPNANFDAPRLYLNDLPFIIGSGVVQTAKRPGVGGNIFLGRAAGRTYHFAVGDLLRYYMYTGDNPSGAAGTVVLAITRI